MTQQEFENLYGKEVSAEQFETYNAMYMMAGDGIDKQAFVADLKKHEDSVLMQAYFKSASENSRRFNTEYIKRKQMKELIAHMLIKKADYHNDDELYRHAISLIGHPACVSYKVANEMELNDEDKELIIIALSSDKK